MNAENEKSPLFTIRKNGTIDGTLFETYFRQISSIAFDDGWFWIFIDNDATDIAVRLRPEQVLNLAEVVKKSAISNPQSEIPLDRAGLDAAIADAQANIPAEKPAAFSYSYDGEHYHGSFSSRNAALTEATDGLDSPKQIFTGRNIPIEIIQVVGDLADEVFNDMQAKAADLAGEAAEGFPWDDVDDAANGDLNEALRKTIIAWAERRGISPQFWTISEVETHSYKPASAASETSAAEKTAEKHD